jgi:hypothetical protein
VRVGARSRIVRRSDFEAADALQDFDLYFTAPSPTAALYTSLEYRVFYYCCAALTHASTSVRSLHDGGAMAGFWNLSASFAFVSTNTFPTPGGSPATAGANVGFFFVASGGHGRWFLFHREYFFAPQPGYCQYDYAQLVVLESTDGGVTFNNRCALPPPSLPPRSGTCARISSRTVIASPVANTAYECALVDGAAYYDADLKRWLYISQCLAR